MHNPQYIFLQRGGSLKHPSGAATAPLLTFSLPTSPGLAGMLEEGRAEYQLESSNSLVVKQKHACLVQR